MCLTLKIATVQPALRLGAVGDNLCRLEDLIYHAIAHHRPDVRPDLVRRPPNRPI